MLAKLKRVWYQCTYFLPSVYFDPYLNFLSKLPQPYPKSTNRLGD